MLVDRVKTLQNHPAGGKQDTLPIIFVATKPEHLDYPAPIREVAA